MHFLLIITSKNYQALNNQIKFFKLEVIPVLSKPLNIAVIIKLEPDFSEGNVSYNPDGTLNRADTKNTLGPHSAIAAHAAFLVE